MAVAARLAAYGAVVYFVAAEAAADLSMLFSGAASVPAPHFTSASWQRLLGYAAGAPCARMATATTALCYLGRDIDGRISSENPLKGRNLRLVDPRLLKAAAAIAVGVVITNQIGNTASHVFKEFNEILMHPELADAKTPHNLAELKARFAGPVTVGSVVAAIAFHYLYNDLTGPDEAPLLSFGRFRRAVIAAGRVLSGRNRASVPSPLQ